MSLIAHPRWEPALARLASLPLAEVLIGICLCTAACLSIQFTRAAGEISLIWPGSAIAATLMIRMPRVRWLSAAVISTAALLLAYGVFAQRPWPQAVGFSALNGLEIALTVVAFRRLWPFPYPGISVNQAAWMTFVLGVAIPAATASLGALFLHYQSGASWLLTWLQWWSSHSIGACLVGPPIILYSLKGLKRLTRSRYAFENGAVFALCFVGCYLTLRYVRFPFVSMAFLLMVAAFRLGGFGASLMCLGVGLLITNLWLLGVRPLGLDALPFDRHTLAGLPILALLATVLPPIAVGLGSDARRASGRALRVSERRFRESMAHSPIGMLISDVQGHWLFSNLALQKMLGYSTEEFQAMPAGGPSAPDDWQESASRWRRLFSGEIGWYEVQRRFRHKDGHWVWAHVAVSLLRDEEGEPLHLIAQIESLEARRQAEESLVAERERLRITLEAIGDAVVTTDAGSAITYVNAAARTLLGLVGDSGVGCRVDEVIHLVDPQTSKTAANLIGQSSYHARTFRREQPCLMHRPDGSICHVFDAVTPVLDSSGALSGFVIVFRDASAEVAQSRDLQYRALHDPLTGLSNRADFAARLRVAFTKAKHIDRAAGLIAIDLDRFKAVNDMAGHAAGDAVLCKVATACREFVRSSDTVARLGGDEFVIILENCATARAQGIAAQLLAALNPLTVEYAGTAHLIYASLGLAMTRADYCDERAWLDAADQACLVAKRQGRSQLQMAAPAALSSL